MRLRAVLLGIVASLLLAAPASAFTPPELFVREQRADITHEPASDWIPLSSAPTLNYIGGYSIGYRLQETGVADKFQTASLTVAAVPDGQPTQPSHTTPYCIGKNGTVGTIVPVDENELQFEGNGTYTLSVSVGPGPPGTGCMGAQGATTAGSFTVDTHVAPELVGQPLAFRATPLPGDPFVGIRAADPPGGFADNNCAIDATVNADGSVAGRLVVPDDDPPRQRVSTFPEPGAWTCVSRGVVEGQNDSFERTFFGTSWSAPLRVDVLSDFQRRQTTITKPRSTKPLFTVTAQFQAASAGAGATFKLIRFVRCKRSGYLFKKVASYKGAFDAKGRAKFRVKRPRKAGYYAASIAFGGTRFVRRGVDPSLVLLGATGRSIKFVKPIAYPRC